MSRERYRYLEYMKEATVAGVNIPTPVLASHYFGLTDDSRIGDIVTPVGDQRGYNPVSHIKRTFAVLNQSGSLATYPSGQASYVFKIGSIPGRFPSISAEIPWADMVIELSDFVRGRLRTKSLLGVTVRELASTIQMVKNPFGLFKRNWRQTAGKLSASALAKRGANLWLEYRYGWNATYVDLKNFCSSYGKLRKALQPVATPGESGFRYASTRTIADASSFSLGSSEWTLSELVARPWSGYSDGFAIRSDQFKSISTGRVTCQASQAALQHYDAFDKVMQSAGVDFESLLPSLWEVIPYSFVVDWFVNAKALQALPAMQRLTSEHVRNLGFSVKTELSWRTRATFCTQRSGALLNESPGYISGKGSVVSFTRHPGLPTDMSVLLGADLSAIQAASGLSLIIQQLFR